VNDGHFRNSLNTLQWNLFDVKPVAHSQLSCYEMKSRTNYVTFDHFYAIYECVVQFQLGEEEQQWWVSVYELIKWVWNLYYIYVCDLTIASACKMVSLILREVVVRVHLVCVLLVMEGCHLDAIK